MVPFVVLDIDAIGPSSHQRLKSPASHRAMFWSRKGPGSTPGVAHKSERDAGNSKLKRHLAYRIETLSAIELP